MIKGRTMSTVVKNNVKPMRIKPFPPWPLFDEDERAAVARVLQSGKVNYWTGEEYSLFEKEFAANIGVNHAVGVMNGTFKCKL